ncbi:hypothetical protein CFI00_03890 [Nocardioides sp. S5]|uniref:anti-sigma factor n=1 Tax=Nocardioides sp. S5 TaxID=2017486 RepID=UPI001A8CD6AB|nr:anti-sigma factor [Nocardioides sp. S5]QSR29658.1 hypothetical protein CFI00_03890 [Nocardioides sp. S5]
MAHADVDDLAALVIEPADVPDPVRRHVGACARCSATVEALTTTRGTLGADPLAAPPPGLRARVMAEALGRPTATGTGTAAGETPPGDPVPLASRRRGGVPLWLASAAAVTALVAGLGMGRMSAGEPEAAPVEPEPTGSVLAATSLTALDSDAPRGAVEAVNDTDDVVTVSVRATELGDDPGFHEVWLINVDGERMVALGILARSDNGTFEVPRRLIEEGYRIVDISVEPDDGDPTHSGVSLARGELV